MSLWARDILNVSPEKETTEGLIDRTLQIEANRAADILEGCASRHSGGVKDVLCGVAVVLRIHLGQDRTPAPEPNDA